MLRTWLLICSSCLLCGQIRSDDFGDVLRDTLQTILSDGDVKMDFGAFSQSDSDLKFTSFVLVSTDLVGVNASVQFTSEACDLRRMQATVQRSATRRTCVSGTDALCANDTKRCP